MIPAWFTNGDLPPGVHFATWAEIEDCLAFNPRRWRRFLGEFFQVNKLTGAPKGILAIRLRGGKRR